MVDRFDGSREMQPYKNGDFVLYSDYAALKAENERLMKALSEQIDRDISGIFPGERALAERAGGLLDPDMPAQEMRLHMGEMTAQEMRTARAAIRWANTRQAERAGGVKVDDLAQEIRRVDGSNSLGAGALAEALMPFLTTEPAAPEGRREAMRIGDAVLDWMVKFDLLDAGNEYYVSDVLAVLNDLTPSTRPSEHAVTDEMVEAASEAIQKFRRTPEQDASGKRYYRIFARSVLEAALAQKEEGR